MTFLNNWHSDFEMIKTEKKIQSQWSMIQKKPVFITPMVAFAFIDSAAHSELLG